MWRDLLTLIAVAGDLDFSEDKTAHNWLHVWSVLQDSVVGLEKSCRKAFLSLQLSHSRAGFAVTPSWLTSAWLLCLHNCSLHGCCTGHGWLSSLYVVRAFMYASQLANISPRHQSYFSICSRYTASLAKRKCWIWATQIESDISSKMHWKNFASKA